MINNRALDEAQDLINYFYHLDDQDDERGHDHNSRYFRASVYRMIVMELHLAIESVLQDVLFNILPQRRVFTVRQNRAYVESLSFSAATELAARLGVLNRKGYDELRRLNAVRNRCATTGYWANSKCRKARAVLIVDGSIGSISTVKISLSQTHLSTSSCHTMVTSTWNSSPSPSICAISAGTRTRQMRTPGNVQLGHERLGRFGGPLQQGSDAAQACSMRARFTASKSRCCLRNSLRDGA